MATGLERLAKEFGGDLPPGLACLSEEQLLTLAEAIESTRDTQAAALTEATDNGLDFIPRLLRGPVKKVLFR